MAFPDQTDDNTDAQPYRPRDLLLIAIWWGLAAGLGEGFLAHSYIWRELLRAGVEFEPLLFVAVALVVIALKRGVFQNSADLMQASFLFSGLALFACITRAETETTALIVLLVSVAAASLVGFLSFLWGRSMLWWQK